MFVESDGDDDDSDDDGSIAIEPIVATELDKPRKREECKNVDVTVGGQMITKLHRSHGSVGHALHIKEDHQREVDANYPHRGNAFKSCADLSCAIDPPAFG